MAQVYDVVIIGGGIAGGALACVLARRDIGVLLLERQTEYRDRVLGEGMMPWGVAESRRSGVEDVLRGNPDGAVTITHWLAYEIGSDPAAVELSALESGLANHVAGIDGILDVRHPVACEAFTEAAGRAGATVVRGVSDVVATFGSAPTVTWSVGGARHDASCRIVVGADGKVSTVRKQASIVLREEIASSVAAGMLAGGLERAPATMGYSLHEIDRHLISFPQSGARARLYVCLPREDRARFTGERGVERFLAAWDSPSLPFGAAITAGRQEGPCGTFPLSSAFVDEPVGEGLVLIGDAAGWVDPLIGQGLAMAMRDVRSVAEILLEDSDWAPAAFAAYAGERRKRLTILALNARVHQRLDVDFSPSFGEIRQEVTAKTYDDPLFQSLLGTQTRGPEHVNPEILDGSERARLSGTLGTAI